MHNTGSEPGSPLEARGWDGDPPSTERSLLRKSNYQLTSWDYSFTEDSWLRKAGCRYNFLGRKWASHLLPHDWICIAPMSPQRKFHLVLYWGHRGGSDGRNCKSPILLDKQDERNTHTHTHSRSKCGCHNKYRSRILKKTAYKTIKIVDWSRKCLELKLILWNSLTKTSKQVCLECSKA